MQIVYDTKNLRATKSTAHDLRVESPVVRIRESVSYSHRNQRQLG